MAKVSRTVDISAPVQAVFNYYARPEHIAKTFPEDVKMKVVPIKVTEGFGLGTVFRIEGQFGGRPLSWDMETVEYENNQKIRVKALNGPFKKNIISVLFEPITSGTKLTFEADYDLGYGIIGKAIDALKLKKEIEMGIERSCDSVKKFIEAGKTADQMAVEVKAGAA